jgi:transcriptional regulator with XRE-family HTH domain
MTTEQDFSSWLHAQLQRREWRAADLARRTGLNSGTISRWANAIDVPSPENCIRLADAFLLDPDDVLAVAGHRIADRPLPPDDPIAELIRMLRLIRPNQDRIGGLRAILEMYLEIDREAPQDYLAAA